MKTLTKGILVVLIPTIALGLAGWWWFSAPSPPEVALVGADPELVEALSEARRRVVREPRSALAWGEMGMFLRGAGYRVEAAECFTQAERLDPNSVRWAYLHGEALFPLDPAESIRLLRRAWHLGATGLEPDLTPALRLVEAYRSQGDTDSAEELLSQLRPRDPDHPVLLFHSGMVAASRSNFAEAKTLLARCLDHPATRRKAHAALAQVCRSLGEIDRADAHSRTTATLPEDLPWPDPHLAACFEKASGMASRLERIERMEAAGQYREAIQALRDLLSRGADYRVLVGLGKDLARVGDLEDAERVLDQAVRLDPEPAQAYFQQGRVSFARGNFPRAVEQVTQGLKRHPHNADGHVLLGRCHESLGETKMAIDAYREALRVSPDLGEAHLHLGEILVREGDREGGRRHLDLAARLARPGDDRAKKALGRVGR